MDARLSSSFLNARRLMQWDHQETVIKIVSSLQRRGYNTWFDLGKPLKSFHQNVRPN